MMWMWMWMSGGLLLFFNVRVSLIVIVMEPQFVVVVAVSGGDASAVVIVGCVRVILIVCVICFVCMHSVPPTNMPKVVVVVVAVGVRACGSKYVAEASEDAAMDATSMVAGGADVELYAVVAVCGSVWASNGKEEGGRGDCEYLNCGDLKPWDGNCGETEKSRKRKGLGICGEREQEGGERLKE